MDQNAVDEVLRVITRPKRDEIGFGFDDERAEPLVASCTTLPTSRFIDEYVRNSRALIVRGLKGYNPFGELHLHIDSDDVQGLVDSSASDAIHVWLRSQSADEKSAEKFRRSLTSIKVGSDDAFKLHVNLRASLYFRASADVEEVLVGKFLSELGFVNGHGEVETFVTTQGHFTGFHTDFQENFTFQLKGRKRWYLRKAPVSAPVRGVTPHYAVDSDLLEAQDMLAALSGGPISCSDEFQSYAGNKAAGVELKSGAPVFSFPGIVTEDLGKGDFLYHPSGIVHAVYTLEDSVSINVSLTGMRYLDRVINLGRAALLRSTAAREYILENQFKPGRHEAEIRTRVVDVLDEMIKSLTQVKEGLREIKAKGNVKRSRLETTNESHETALRDVISKGGIDEEYHVAQ